MGLVIRVQISGANVASLLLWWQVIASLIIGCVIITLSRSSFVYKGFNINYYYFLSFLAVKSPAECFILWQCDVPITLVLIFIFPNMSPRVYFAPNLFGAFYTSKQHSF